MTERTRYSGDVTIQIVLTDQDHFVCLVSEAGNPPYKMSVDPPKVLEHALDSEEMFDSVAAAALSFLIAEAEAKREYILQSIAYTETGIHIGRTMNLAQA